MAVLCTDGRPIDTAVWIGSDLSVQIFDQIGGILRISTRQAVHINDLGTDLIGKRSDLSDTEVRFDAALSRIVVEPMDLFFALFLRSQRRLPVEQVGDRTARIADRTKADLLIQLLEVFLYLHRLRVKAAIAIEGVAVIDAEDRIAVDRTLDIAHVDREHDRCGRLIERDCLAQLCLRRQDRIQGWCILFQQCLCLQDHLVQFRCLRCAHIQLPAVVELPCFLQSLCQIRFFDVATLFRIDRPCLCVGQHLFINAQFIDIAPHRVRIAIVCVFVPADQQRGRRVHDIVIQRFFAVQHTVDVKLHLVVCLIKGDRDVLPAAA